MKEEQEQQRIIFLKGKTVILRLLRKDTDLEIAVRWRNDPEIRKCLGVYVPLPIHQEEKWFDNLGKEKNDIILGIETLGGVYIGNLGLHDINSKDRVAVHGISIGEKDYWGKGHGTDAGLILLNYAFNTLNLRKVCSSVIGFNKRSLNYHLKCGYKIVGKWHKQMFCNGRYYDQILMEVFKKDWLVCWRKYKKTK